MRHSKSKKREEPKRSVSRVCKNCGAEMDIFEDRYGHRKLICNSCKSMIDVEETDKERVDRVRSDMTVKSMKDFSDNPMKETGKAFIAIMGPAIIGVLLLILFNVVLK